MKHPPALMARIPGPSRAGCADRAPSQRRTAAAADSQLPPGRTGATPATRSHRDNEPATATTEELFALYRTLIDADERNDTAALAQIGWILFTMADAAQQAHRETAGLLGELRAAASAAAAGQGSHASLALLRHVLAKHGWLPPADATPLQVLAAPR
jgi:hypothetical protein